MPSQPLVRTNRFFYSLVLLSFWLSVHASTAWTEAVDFERPGVEVISSTTREILANPEFAPELTFLQWLGRVFSAWDGPDFSMPDGFGEVLRWIILVWCVLTLVAIFIHLAWSVTTLIQSGSKRERTAAGALVPKGKGDRSFEAWCGEMHRLAQAGCYREALAAMLQALLKKLDAQGVLRIHPSKTNGDYVREYPPAGFHQGLFREFTRAFDFTIYRGVECDADTYQAMLSRFQEMDDHAVTKP